ncbi:hypothetical protein AMATHDRAFT_146756 [Amanita thiersii Skay4041]|uniref:Guanine nucleotide-binding protein-like 1 n=1 Tax=Amanita thiersii Skay4041 TaxID=703135 RepID=A0A2A9NKE8_9AGAR|nr:hypothetical protein AMATHDRAFT_146756 [Amanita thiersii Skay4041]
MPARRKPISTRQKKADQKLKRAIKRGDAPPSEPKPKPNHRRSRGRGGSELVRDQHAESVRRIQSAFITLPPRFLEETKLIASTTPLHRPIAAVNAIINITNDLSSKKDIPVLTCPRRPKWRYDMSKKEVEHNEEGWFKKWLEKTDEDLRAWQDGTGPFEDAGSPSNSHTVRSPSYFERNLEVWRQLWRVAEISQIILVLLDSRCPLLHYPPSLHSYLADRKVIFVLTKIDITGPPCTEAWKVYLHEKYPGMRIVQVESYTEKSAEQGRVWSEPHIPEELRSRLIEAIREAHAELLEPPEKVKANSSWLSSWKPPVKREIDWNVVINGSVGEYTPDVVRIDNELSPESKEGLSGESSELLEHLTIGLIGQPNVGKSSLLNALFGEHKVKASRTPGKTKHFQTLFWTRHIRLVDCPGLVIPNYLPMEIQVLSGILPISRVSAVPACIHYIAKLMPLERILKLNHPSPVPDSVQDKRTWRKDVDPGSGQTKTETWTAMDILVAYAHAKRWVTAKAARPDVHRAGNAILRLLSEGKIGWAFWPPRTEAHVLEAENGAQNGIWIPRFSGDLAEDSPSDTEAPANETPSEDSSEESQDGALDDIEEASDDANLQTTSGRFSALIIDEQEDEEDDI